MVWVSLIHNGIAIPKTYNYINHIKIYYKNTIINVNNNLATAFYFFKKQPHTDKIFIKNFMNSIKSYLPIHCKNCEMSDFKIIILNNKIQKQLNNYDKFKNCYVNGKKENIDRYFAEPACIFIGRGQHKFRGSFKPAIKESDITLNISKGHKPNGNWKLIICNKKVDWIACWEDPVLNKIKYIYPSSSSILKSSNTVAKFDFARKIKKKLNYIRKKYIIDFNSSNEKVIQHAEVGDR